MYNGYTWDGEKWGVTSNPTASGAVRYDLPQGLTAPQQTQSRQNVYAAPFDAMAYNGMQINGSMEVSQERGYSNPVTVGTNTYFCDGWTASKAGSTMAGSAQSLAGSVGTPFQNTAVIGISAAQATILSGDYFTIGQPVEGYRIQRLMWGTSYAQPITLGFWTVHHRTGIYSGSIRNADGSRSCAFTYSQIASDAAEYKTVTIPGCLDGTWPIGNAASMSVTFAIAAGSNFTAPSAGVWYSGFNYLAGPGQINGVAATTDAFRITGVVVLPGIEAPSAARSPLIMRPYDQELRTCKRYFYNGVPSLKGSVSVTGLSALRISGSHPVEMCYAPSLLMTANLPVFDGNTVSTITSIGAVYNTTTVLEIDTVIATGLTANKPMTTYQGAGGNLNVIARL